MSLQQAYVIILVFYHLRGEAFEARLAWAPMLCLSDACVHDMKCALLNVQGGRTPLHLAALQGHMKLVKLLENSGADVNAADEHGMAPLHKAAVQGHADTVQELLAHGARIDAKLTVG